jgi:NADPH:quinone reductase-like Zn-dependent oxidoreductase
MFSGRVAHRLSAATLPTPSSLGVDEAIDYTAVDVAAAVRDVDVVFDLVGSAHSIELARTVAKGGLIIPVPGG